MEAEDITRGLAPGPPRPGLVPVSIIGAEDEDFENELETNTEEQNSQFQSLEQVKRRPAHLMALLQHVALQFEPGPLLCCLHADMLASLGPKEAKKAFLDFYHSFLDKTAVLRVPVPPTVAFELDRTRPDLLPEDVQRQFVQDVVQSQQAAVSRLLEDFRSKRLMGMTPWEHDLTQLEAWVGRDRASFEARERHLAERLLAHLEEMQPTISTDEEKSAAVVNAVSLYLRHLGVRTKSGDKKSGRNFFRKKMMGNRRSDEPTKTKKGLSIFLDAARWNRGEPQGEVPGLCPPRLPHTAPASWSHLSFQPPISDTSKSRLMLRSQALRKGGEAWGCPPGTGMLGLLGRMSLEFLCTLCLETVLTRNQVLMPHQSWGTCPRRARPA